MMRVLSKGLILFATTFGVVQSPRLSAAAPSCSEEIGSLARANIEKSLEPFHAEMDLARVDIEESVRKTAESCGGLQDPECLKKAVAAGLESTPKNGRLSKFFESKKEMTCILSKQRSARDKFVANSNMALNLGASMSVMYLFHQHSKNLAQDAGEPPPEFNYALLASGLIFNVYRSIVQCRNELDAAIHSSVAPSAQTVFKQKFLRYTQLNLIGNGMYIGLVAGQDVLHGRNPFEKDNLEKYFHEFAFAMAWDTGFGVINIKILDKMFLKSLPNLTQSLAQKIREGVIRPVFRRVGGKPTVVLKIENLAMVPGFMMETLLRVAWTADRTAAFLKLRESYMGWAVDDTTPH